MEEQLEGIISFILLNKWVHGTMIGLIIMYRPFFFNYKEEHSSTESYLYLIKNFTGGIFLLLLLIYLSLPYEVFKEGE